MTKVDDSEVAVETAMGPAGQTKRSDLETMAGGRDTGTSEVRQFSHGSARALRKYALRLLLLFAWICPSLSCACFMYFLSASLNSLSATFLSPRVFGRLSIYLCFIHFADPCLRAFHFFLFRLSLTH